METTEAWSFAVQAIALAIPLVLALTAIIRPLRAPQAAGVVVSLAFLLAAGAALTAGTQAPPLTRLPVRVDVPTCVMLLLVSTIGLVIVRYSRTYLRGEPRLAAYFRWLLLTLSAVTALVISNNLLLLVMAWTATSLALHRLLTFYPDREAALVAAHKKFLVSRMADISLLIFVSIVYANVGSLDLDQIEAWVRARAELTPSMQLAAMLLVVAVALKSAQLPFHGWLTQVMEAPTPVSALLHAGVVNIGGFVLIRLAPWMGRAEPAQLLLVVIGLTSAIVAALVMTTRVSIKVALAWSTCAQMGFMLVQCGLGLWHLALLHLVAHSLYKTHAFLSTGTAVDRWRIHALNAHAPVRRWGPLIAATLAALGTSAAGVALLREAQWPPVAEWSTLFFAATVSLSMAPLLSRNVRGSVAAGAFALRVGGVVLLYVAGHVAAAQWMPTDVAIFSPQKWIVAGAGLASLFITSAILLVQPNGRLARAAHPWLFAGLHLDERMTRLTFLIWPPRLRSRRATSRPVSGPQTMEVAT